MYSTYFWLCLTAFLAGIINALAGGGTLLTFPALLAGLAVGNPGVPVGAIANATSTVALVPSALSSAWAYRRELVSMQRWLVLLVGPSIVGGVLGAVLVILFPDEFDALVPVLILTASVLFMLQPVVARWLGHAPTKAPSRRRMALVVLLQLGVAIYGGYFGAGIGILMLSALGLMGLSNLHEMNALKVVLGACINGMAVAVFVVHNFWAQHSLIHWPFALAMMGAALVGGYVGAKYGRMLPSKYIRYFVIAVGLSLTAWYFAKPYLEKPQEADGATGAIDTQYRRFATLAARGDE
jgi:uncharacterized membrane protein YfcA